MTDTRPRTTLLIRLAAGGALLAVLVAAGFAVNAARQPDKRTPCQAAEDTIKQFRHQSPSTVGYLERSGGGYGSMLRGLITGDYEDVEGVASPELAGHLRTVADDLATAEGAAPDEFTTGETGRHIDALLASCR